MSSVLKNQLVPGFKVACTESSGQNRRSRVSFDSDENLLAFAQRIQNGILTEFVTLSAYFLPCEGNGPSCVLEATDKLKGRNPYRFVTDLLRQQEAERSKTAEEPVYEQYVYEYHV